jgi:hypothetical protein
VEWTAQGILGSGPWAPPITILGQYETGNALQRISANNWGNVVSGANYRQGFPFLIHAGPTGFICLPETAPLPPNSTVSPEACIAACGARLAPNNAFYFANLYGKGIDECGKYCTCSRTCRETRDTSGQTMATVTFTNVTTGGVTTIVPLTSSSPSFTPLPSNFALGDPPVYYDISTTAAYSPPVTICLQYANSQPGTPHLLHYTGGTWYDVTSSSNLATFTVCGEVESFSNFGVGFDLEGGARYDPQPAACFCVYMYTSYLCMDK